MINPDSTTLTAIAYGIALIIFLLLIIAGKVTFKRK